MKPNCKLVLKVDGEIMMDANFNVEEEEGLLSKICDSIGEVIEKSKGIEMVEPMLRDDK